MHPVQSISVALTEIFPQLHTHSKALYTKTFGQDDNVIHQIQYFVTMMMVFNYLTSTLSVAEAVIIIIIIIISLLGKQVTDGLFLSHSSRRLFSDSPDFFCLFVQTFSIDLVIETLAFGLNVVSMQFITCNFVSN
jgi:hypothetical protein